MNIFYWLKTKFYFVYILCIKCLHQMHTLNARYKNYKMRWIDPKVNELWIHFSKCVYFIPYKCLFFFQSALPQCIQYVKTTIWPRDNKTFFVLVVRLVLCTRSWCSTDVIKVLEYILQWVGSTKLNLSWIKQIFNLF